MLNQAESGQCRVDPVRDVKRLRWWVYVIAYSSVTLAMPYYHFGIGMSWLQAAAPTIVGYAITTLAVEFAYPHMLKLRKQGMSPSLLAVELESARDLRQACQ